MQKNRGELPSSSCNIKSAQAATAGNQFALRHSEPINMQPSESSNQLLERYEQQPVIRGLVQLIPFSIGSAIESALLTQLNRYREEKLRVFFDELSSGSVPLTEDLIRSNDFLHCYFATLSAVLRSRKHEKIKFLAKLLHGIIDRRVADVDEYEELIGLTDELSLRELTILTLLSEHEKDNPLKEGENELQRASRFWPGFLADVESKLGLGEELLRAMLTRLQRSGCYAEFTGSYLSYTGGIGRTTNLYLRLARAAGTIDDIAG